MQTTSPFGSVSIDVHPNSVSFRFADTCVVNGVSFKGGFHVKVPDGSDNEYSNKFRMDYQSRYVRRTNPPSFAYGKDQLSDNTFKKIENWACKEAELHYTPDAKRAAELTQEENKLARMKDDLQEVISKHVRIMQEIREQEEKIAALR